MAKEKANSSLMFQHNDDINKETIEKFFLNPFPSKRIGDIKSWPQYVEKYKMTFNSFQEYDKHEAKIALNKFLENVNSIKGIFSLTKTKRNLLQVCITLCK